MTAAAKKTGDYAVLSQTDMTLLALTVCFHDESESSKPSSTADGEESAVRTQQY